MEASEPIHAQDNGQHIIEAKRAKRELNFFLYIDNEWNWQKIENIFMSFYPKERYIKIARDELKKYQREGHDLNDEKVVDFFRSTTTEAINNRMCDMDNYSQIAFMGVGYDLNGNRLQFKYQTAEFFTDNIVGGGKFGFIDAGQSAALGVGKTDFALRMVEMLLAVGECVVTNIECTVDHPNFHRCITLKQAIRQCISNLIHGKTTVLILDEVPQFLVKERGTSKENVSMNTIQYLFRKMGISMIVIAQLEKKVPTNIKDMSVWHVLKESKSEMTFRKTVGRNEEYYQISNVPRTNIKFETGESASFVSEFDVKELHGYIVQQEEQNLNNPGKYGGKSQLQVILDYIDKDSKKVTEADLKVAVKVLFVHSRMTQKDIGFVIGKSQGTVSNWLKGMAIPTEQEASMKS
jgi:hypothetical protein